MTIKVFSLINYNRAITRCYVNRHTKAQHKTDTGNLKSNTKQFTKENVERTSRVEFTLEYARGIRAEIDRARARGASECARAHSPAHYIDAISAVLCAPEGFQRLRGMVLKRAYISTT